MKMKSYLVIKYASHYSCSSDYDLSAKYVFAQILNDCWIWQVLLYPQILLI